MHVYTGQEARKLLESRRSSHSGDNSTSVSVGRSRWQEAQRYELQAWMQHAKWAISDRNEAHRDCFEGYAALRNRVFQRAIELGCGPFTNMRFIMEECRINDLCLLDPLAHQYMRHPYCRYHRSRLGGLFNDVLGALPGYMLRPGAAWRKKRNDIRIGGLWGRPVTMVATAIEEMETARPFDLVVMINVLEHCRDAKAVLAKIDESLDANGIFVYHDKMYNGNLAAELHHTVFDAGHPLRVEQSMIEDFLSEHFDTIFRSEHTESQEFEGIALPGTSLYYIGAKTG
jgi:SAM-dependent methyltransferase